METPALFDRDTWRYAGVSEESVFPGAAELLFAKLWHGGLITEGRDFA